MKVLPMSTIAERKLAAARWRETWREKFGQFIERRSKPERALLVLLFTEGVNDYLAEYDPQALKQAQESLTGESWEKYL